MRSSELEAWAIRCVDRVLAGGRVEDDRVECKADWIDPPKAARRIGGQANAAHGEPVLWIIGLDEDAKRLSPVSDVDLADWWARVESRFDEMAPSMQSLSVQTGRGNVTALLFETDRAPYVVKAASGTEVPYRIGTRVRSATRSDLMRVLAPSIGLPNIEVLEVNVTVRHQPAAPERVGPSAQRLEARIERLWCDVRATIFFYVERPVLLPDHQQLITIEFTPADTTAAAHLRAEVDPWVTPYGYRPAFAARGEPARPDPPRGAQVRAAGLHLSDTDAVSLNGSVDLLLPQIEIVRSSPAARLRASFGVAGSERSVVVDQSFKRDYSIADAPPPNDQYAPCTIALFTIPVT